MTSTYCTTRPARSNVTLADIPNRGATELRITASSITAASRTTEPVKLSGHNPGQLRAAARLYQHLVYAHPDAPEAERWAYLAAWYFRRAAGQVRPAHSFLQVKLDDLAAGDVFEDSFFSADSDAQRWEIVNIGPRVPAGRWAYVRNLATSDLQPRILDEDGAWGYSVVAGLKVEALANHTRGVRIMPHPRYGDVFRWLTTVVNTPPTPDIAIVEVDGRALAAGDVVRIGSRRLLIVDIRQPFMPVYHGRLRGYERRALVQWCDSNPVKPTPYTCNLRFFSVVGGPKLAAARANPDLVKRMPAGYWLWIGDRSAHGG